MNRSIKGLMIKDLKLIVSQMKLFLIIIVGWSVFMLTQIEGSFFVGYITLMFSFITLSTFSYDETEKGLTYLFTLPIVRRDYLREKYLLGLLISTLPALLIVLLFSCISFIVTGTQINLLDYFLSSVVMIPMGVFILALEIPLYIKFEQEKRRIVNFICIGGISACFGILNACYEILGGDSMKMISSILGMNVGWLILLIILVTMLLTIISYKISCFLLERRQF